MTALASLNTPEAGAAPDMSLLDDLLDGLTVEAATPARIEVTEVLEPVGLAAVDANEDLLDAAADQLANEEIYKAQDEMLANIETSDADKPTVEEKAPEKKEKPKAERVFFASNRKSAVLDSRLGGKTADFLVLEYSDASLTPEELQVKQTELREQLDTTIAKKVAEKCIMLFRDVAAGRPVSNRVMQLTFETLARDGYLTGGKGGNLQTTLRGSGLSDGTAASQGNQMFALLPFLKITGRDKGRMEPNPDSTILATVNTLHKLTPKA